jgi:molybdenum cofactor cytidylyltransferase
MRKIEGIVLAAGLSSRMGCHKMALPLGDKTVIERSIEGMYTFVHRIVVVGGWQVEHIRELLAGYDKVEVVVNEDYRAGMFSSVQTGVAHVRAPWFFLLPGDYPFIGRKVYERLLDTQGDVVIPTFGGKKGHPVLFRGQPGPEILDMPEDATLRDYIEAQGYVTVAVEDEGILLDLDRPADYEILRKRYHPGP